MINRVKESIKKSWEWVKKQWKKLIWVLIIPVLAISFGEEPCGTTRTIQVLNATTSQMESVEIFENPCPPSAENIELSMAAAAWDACKNMIPKEQRERYLREKGEIHGGSRRADGRKSTKADLLQKYRELKDLCP